MYELEDQWLNAINSLPDAKPLADLLRSQVQIPAGARDLLAELLEPTKPDITGGRLVYEKTDGIDKAINEWLPLAAAYREEHRRRRDAKKPDASQAAARTVGKKHSVNARTVYRAASNWMMVIQRLRGKGTDKD